MTAEVVASLNSFRPQYVDVWINLLWFSSLVVSLIAASLGILIKQWLQRYKTEDYSLARERTRIRQHRFAGLLRWGIPSLVSFLPSLLRTSLNLFFIGLMIFLRSLFWPVAAVVSVLIGLWFVAYFSFLVFPALFADCPYKSPEAMMFYLARRCAEDGFSATIENVTFISWSDAEELVKTEVSLDLDTLATVDQTFSDSGLQGTIRGCLKDVGKDDVLNCIRRIISSRLHTRADRVSKWWSLNTSRITRCCAETLIHILLDTLERVEGYFLGLKDTPGRIRASRWLGEAMECVIYLLNCIGGDLEMPSLDERLVTALPKLIDLVWSWNDVPALIQSDIVAVICSRPSLCQASLTPGMCAILYTIAEGS